MKADTKAHSASREVQIEREPYHAKRLSSLLTLSYEPMFAWQLDGPINFWNAGAELLYGFASEEAIGHSSHALLQTNSRSNLLR